MDEKTIFELTKKPVNKEKSRAFGSAHPIWLRAVRELRTVILSGWHSYEMDAAVKMIRGEEPFTEEAMRWMEKGKPTKQIN